MTGRSASWYQSSVILLAVGVVSFFAAPARRSSIPRRCRASSRTLPAACCRVWTSCSPPGTGLERRAVTNEAGLYTFPNVPVGDYRITATLSGFKPVARTGVRVNAGLNIRVDVSSRSAV